MGTKKISQLDTIADSNLSGEAILPVVVSDPLIPNRKAKVNQLFKGMAQGTKADPGLCFDLDRDTGLYQTAYDQLGIGFGDGGLYLSRISNSSTSSSLYMTAVDETAINADIVLSPKGTGSVKVTGQFLISDQEFVLEDAQGPRARFEVSNIGTGTATRIFTFPAITSGSGTTIVGDDTSQTLQNKTINIDKEKLVLLNGSDKATFEMNYVTSQGLTRTFKLPDAGTVTTTAEPTATASTLIDTKATQTILNKTFAAPKFAANAELATKSFQFNTDALTADRIITLPDLSLTLVGLDNAQTLTAKTIVNLILADDIDATKRLTFNLSNLNTSTNNSIGYPPTDTLNNPGAVNVTVLEKATQDLFNKTLVLPKIKDTANSLNLVTLDTSNITGNRTIKFPDSDATLLSTDNVTVDDVNFGAGIGAENLTGRTRLQQFFYAGF